MELKKTGRKLLPLLGMLILGVVLYTRHHREPEYHSRKVSEWLEDLSSDSQEKVEAAEEAVKVIGTDGLPAILGHLGAQDSELKIKLVELMERQSIFKIKFIPALQKQEEALSALLVLGNRAQSIFPEIMELEGRGVAADTVWEALTSVMADQDTIILASLSALTNGSPEMQLTAVKLLHHYPEVRLPPSAAEVAVRFLKAKNVDVRVLCVETLRRVTVYESNRKFVAGLVAALRDPAESVRAEAVRALTELRDVESIIGPDLLMAAKDPNIEIRLRSIALLGRISGPTNLIVPALLSALSDSNAGVRFSAIESLSYFKDTGVLTLPVLLPVLKDRDPGRRIQAAGMLGKNIDHAADIVPVLIASLQDEDRYVRYAVILALGNLGLPARASAPLFVRIIEDTASSDEEIIAARWALKRVAPGGAAEAEIK